MTKNIQFDKALIITAIFVFIIGIFTGDITFQRGVNGQKYISEKEIIENFSKIENITGKFYWSPDDSRSAFTESLKSTKNTLKIQTYEFTKKELKNYLRDLLQKGVDVKLIMEDKKYQQYTNTRRQIQQYFSGYDNFEIKNDKQMGTMYTHSKINLVDSGFWIQTANLTHSSFFKNREHFFFSENQDVLASLNTIFDKDRQGQAIELIDIHPNLVVCNINCRTVIEHIISSAKKSILIQTQYIVDPAILEILREKSILNNMDLYEQIPNTNFRFIVSDTEANNDLVDYFGPGVARKFAKFYNHTKMILIDDEILLLGSMNLSDNSLDKNREIGIIIIDPDIIKKFKEQFEKDWSNCVR